MKRALTLLFVALATVAVALLLWYMRSVIGLVLAAILLGATLRPTATRLSDWGVPRSLSTLLMILLVFALVLGLVAVLGFALGEELPQLLRDVQLRAIQLRSEWRDGTPWQQTIAANIASPMSLDDIVTSLDTMFAEQTPATAVEDTEVGESASTTRDRAASAMLRLMINSAGSVAGLIAQLVILIFVSLYWSLEREWFERLWISLLPNHQRQPVRATWRAVELNVGMHVRSEVVQSLVAGLVVYLGFRLMGVNQPLLLATTVALAWLIPLVGGVLALIVLVPIAMLSPLWVLIVSSVLVVGVLLFMEFVAEPWLDKAREQLEIAGLIMAMIMLQLFGIVGLVLASPLAVAISTGITTWRLSNLAVDQTTVDTSAEMRERLAALRERVTAKGDSLPKRTRSLYARLEEVAEAAEQESAFGDK